VGFATISTETSCNLGAPNPGTNSANTTTLCIGQSATLTLTGYTGGIYWQKSTDNSKWSYITGANNSTLNTGAISQNTYFRASVSNCCEAFSNSILITYVASLSPMLSTIATNITCNGLTNGAINLNVSQGSGSYSYLWSNAATTQNISLLATGTYAVTVTDINTHCSNNDQSTISQPDALAVSVSKIDETCTGAANGSAIATPSGGTLPYAYSWSNGGNAVNNTGLTSGLYSVTVTDNKACTISSSTSIDAVNSAPPTTLIHHD
jgi:large repetitive protein